MDGKLRRPEAIEEAGVYWVLGGPGVGGKCLMELIVPPRLWLRFGTEVHLTDGRSPIPSSWDMGGFLIGPKVEPPPGLGD